MNITCLRIYYSDNTSYDDEVHLIIDTTKLVEDRNALAKAIGNSNARGLLLRCAQYPEQTVGDVRYAVLEYSVPMNEKFNRGDTLKVTVLYHTKSYSILSNEFLHGRFLAFIRSCLGSSF